MSQNARNRTSSKKSNPMPMGPGSHMTGVADKASDFKGSMKKLLQYIRQYWISIIIVLVFAIGSTIFAIISPKILGEMTNQVVSDYVDMRVYDEVSKNFPENTPLPAGTTGDRILSQMPESIADSLSSDQRERIRNLDFSHRPGIDFAKIRLIAIQLLLLYLLSSAFSYIQSWIMTNISQKITYRFRKDISEKINRLPLSYFDKQTFGEVLSRVTNDVDTVGQTLNQGLTQLVTSITMIVGILIMMLTISWNLTLVAVVTVPLSMILIMIIVKKSQHYFKEQQDTLGSLNGHVEEMYAGHSVMRVMGGEQRSIQKFQDINDRLYGSAWKSQFLSGLMFPIMAFIGNLGFVGVSVLGGWLAIQGRLQIGDIQAFIQYVNQFNQPIAQTAQIANVLQSTAAAAERVFEFLEEKEESPDPKRTRTPADAKGEITFKNVSFGYTSDKKVIKGFTAHIKPGQMVAIVGPTGAGKTTMVNLLMRFYEIDDGTITIDGIDIGEMRRADLRKLFGMVLQETWLFNGTIKENIAYGRVGASEDEIRTAAENAHADHFIHAHPHGYEMELNEEADNISQGEKQLLTIARAMLADTPILILDEATSSVDTRTEILIQRAMEKLMRGKTSFVIAHRLSTVRGADLILVMKDGNIVEQGKHDQLLKKDGFYASIYNSQFTRANSTESK